MYIRLRISKVELKNQGGFTLIIFGDYPSGHLNYDFEIEYSGTDVVIRKGNLLYNQEEHIRDILRPLIGYSPFDLKEVKNILVDEDITFKYI